MLCQAEEVAVEVESGCDLLGSGHHIEHGLANGFQEGEVDAVGIGVLFVLAHGCDEFRIVVAGNGEGTVVGLDVLCKTVNFVGGEILEGVAQDELGDYLDFLAVGNGQVIGLLGEGKQELSYVRSYLTKGVANWGDGYRVKILEREKVFLSELAAVEPKEVDQEQEEKVKSFLTSLIV